MLCDYCDEPDMFFTGKPKAFVHWSPIGECSDEDTDLYLRYYADAETRARWAAECGVVLPPSELPPYPRPWIPTWDPCSD